MNRRKKQSNADALAVVLGCVAWVKIWNAIKKPPALITQVVYGY